MSGHRLVHLFIELAGWAVTDQLICTVEHGISHDEHVLVNWRVGLEGVLGLVVVGLR